MSDAHKSSKAAFITLYVFFGVEATPLSQRLKVHARPRQPV